MENRSALVALGLLALLALAATVLWPGVHGPFLFDDFPNLKNLAEINGHPTWRSIGVYLSLFPGTPGRPLATLSFLLNDFGWPSDPFGFKVTNLLIHLLNGALVFGLARSLGHGMARADASPSDKVATEVAALACSAIWLLSPIQVSAVFLTVQRMTELAATFAFAGLWGFFALLSRGRTSAQALGALAVLATGTILSFLSKENGALVPLLALVACLTILRDSLQQLTRPARRLALAGLMLPSVGVAYVLLQRILHAPDGLYTGRNFGLWERLMTEARVLLDYAALIVAPRLSSSSLYNDDYAISKGWLEPGMTLPAIIVVVGMLAAAIWSRRRHPLFSFAILWFLAGHAIESTVVALEIYFEHRNYVPLFGPAFAIAHAAIKAKGKLRAPARMGLVAWLLLATGIMFLQARTWGSEQRIATYWHLEHPSSLRAQQQYAQFLLKSGRPEEARGILGALNQQQGSPFDSELQLMTLDCDAGRHIDPSRIQHVALLARTSRHTPGTALILARLRRSVQASKCPTEVSPETWLQLTSEAIKGENGGGIARMVRVERAELYLAADRLDLAIGELRAAYGKGKKAEPRVAFYAAALLATAGRYDEARTWASLPLSEPWSWKNWVAQTDLQARELVEAIDQAEQAEAK